MDREQSPADAERAAFSRLSWRFERVSADRLDLVLWSGPETAPQSRRVRISMTQAEALALSQSVDRVQSLARESASGTFTGPGPSPHEVREQLGIQGYIVTSADQAAHDALVAETPWAHWVEEVTPQPDNAVTWFADVFVMDEGRFVSLAARHGSHLAPARYDPEPQGS